MANFTIEGFFSKTFETVSTSLLLNNHGYFSSSVMKDYLSQLASYRLTDYLQYLTEHPNTEEITSKDITQLSSMADCTINMCNTMFEKGNKGFTLVQIATNLHKNDKYKDNLVALTKYGENQVKTAHQMGLTILHNDLWYLTSIGYIIYNLSEDIQNKFFAINLLRDPFYSKVILSLHEKDTNLRDFMTILSESTQKRRTPSCMKILSYYIRQCEIEKIQLNK